MRRIQDAVDIVFWECQNKYLFPILAGTECKGLWPNDMEKKKIWTQRSASVHNQFDLQSIRERKPVWGLGQEQ